jgi:hypothetical protein
MGGGKSAGSGTKIYDYFGTIAGVVCAGPVDELVSIIVDGRTVWPNAPYWVAGQVRLIGDLRKFFGVVYKATQSHTTSNLNQPPTSTHWVRYTLVRTVGPSATNPYPLTVDGYGAAFLYWGTDNQTLDSVGEAILATNGHPNYRRQCVLLLKAFLFGRERTSAPNVEVIVRRKPNQTIITGDPAALIDGQANPVAAMADLYTDRVFGAALTIDAPGGPDSTTWQSAATAIQSNIDEAGISPVLTQAKSLRQITADILAYCDGWVRFSAAGEIEAGRFPHNAAPPAFSAATTIDYHDLIDEVSYTADGWATTFNQVQVKFDDRERSYKDGSLSVVSGYNYTVTGEPRTAKLDRPWITRRTQASKHAAEYQKIIGEPKLSGSLVVRAEKAASIRPGDLFLLTHDALSVSIICRCIGKDLAQPPAGRATIRFESDRASAPVPFAPTAAPDEGSAYPDNETLSLQQFFQPPPLMFSADTDAAVVPLIARTSPVTIAANIWLRKEDATGFYILTFVEQFAIHGTIQASWPYYSRATATRTRSTNVATVTTSAAHNLTSGDVVTIFGFADATFDGQVTITVINSTTFTYPNTGSVVTTTTDTGGTVTTGNEDNTENLRVTLNGGTIGADLEKMLSTQTEDAINDNAVYVIIFKASDRKVFEVCTLRAMRVLSGDSFYRLKVRRARYGTSIRTADIDDKVWIGYRSDLKIVTHESFVSYLEALSTVIFRLQSINDQSMPDVSDTTLCPDISYTFADPYAPTTTFLLVEKYNQATDLWNPLTVFTGHFEILDRFRVTANIIDASADLIGAEMYAKSGSNEISLWSANYTQSSNQKVVVEFGIPSRGAWQVFMAGIDSSGRIRRKQLTAGGGSTSVLINIKQNNTETSAPTFTPGGVGFRSSQFPISVVLATTTAGAQIKYSIVNLGAAVGAFTNVAATSTTVVVGRDKRLYAKADVGGAHESVLLYHDYYVEVDTFYPIGTQPP